MRFAGRLAHGIRAAMTQPRNMPAAADFADIRDWVFDLDNTLYPHNVDLFSQVDVNMTSYVADLLQTDRASARKLQSSIIWNTAPRCKGLMLHHGVDPDDFLEKAHAIDYTSLTPQPALAAAIKALPGRKFIFTNGSVKHAQDTAGALGILDHFDEIFDIVAADYLPKPAAGTYDKFAGLHKIDTQNAAMFEDLPRNLTVPKALGMKTVLLVPQNIEGSFTEWWERHSDDDQHIDYITDDLTTFLSALV